jgi:hypothetical protein
VLILASSGQAHDAAITTSIQLFKIQELCSEG